MTFLYLHVTASFTHPCGCWEEGGGCDPGGWDRGEGQGRSVKCHPKDHLLGPPSKGKKDNQTLNSLHLIFW